jgi:phosphomannomutase
MIENVRLDFNTASAKVMSNMWLEIALGKRGWILTRLSDTETVIRITVKGEN